MNKVYYSEVMEDWNIIQHALQLNKGDNVLSIASAGDNIFHALLYDINTVKAVDINKYQINVSQLKQACIANLNYTDFLVLLGLENGDRKNIIDSFNFDWVNKLDYDYKNTIIKNGIINIGELSKFLKEMQKNLDFLIGKSSLVKFFFSKNLKEKQDLWEKYFQTNEVNSFFSDFLSDKNIVDSFIPKHAFGNMADNPFYIYYLKRLKERLVDYEASKNYFLYRMLLGTTPKEQKTLLPYMQKKHYEQLKNNISKINWETGSIVDIVQNSNDMFDKVNLSNVPDWLDEKDYTELWFNLTQKVTSGGRVFARSFLNERSIPKYLENEWESKNINEYASSHDKVGYFSRYNLWIKK